ncbi:MAG: molecular chaperone DnaJ, partial [Lentisphaerae bacterium]|nr:molecular chaperone DnaJ [Lentisphaerota bacterium]
EAEQKFKELAEAYEVLNDPDKRHKYDHFGHDGLKSAFGPGGFDFSRDFTHFSDLNDLFGGLFSGGGGIFDALFGQTGRRQSSHNQPLQGSDLRYDMELDFEDAIFGTTRKIDIPVSENCKTCSGTGSKPGTSKETCRHCNGQGSVISSTGWFRVQQNCPICNGAGEVIAHPCKTCHGVGLVKKREQISLKVPPGVDTGSRMRLTGKGEAGLRGGPAGDLIVVIRVRQHILFQRQGDDLFCEMPIPVETAILGGEIQVPTLENPATIKVPAGVASGHLFRLKGHGVQSVGGYNKGDLHVRLVVEMTKHLSGSQKKKLREFIDSCSPDNYPDTKKFNSSFARYIKPKK